MLILFMKAKLRGDDRTSDMFGGSEAPGLTRVKGHVRKDGVFVAEHNRKTLGAKLKRKAAPKVKAAEDPQMGMVLEQGSERKAEPKKAAVSVDAAWKKASWVIKNKETGEVVMETFDQKKVDALNTKKYEAVPIGGYLGAMNAKPAPKATPNPEAKDAEVEPADSKAEAGVIGRDAMIAQYGAHRQSFLSRFSGYDATKQRNFVEAAEKAFGKDEIRSLGDGYTVQVDEGDGTITTHMWSGSGIKKNDKNATFIKMNGSMPIERSVTHRMAAKQEKPEPKAEADPAEPAAKDPNAKPEESDFASAREYLAALQEWRERTGNKTRHEERKEDRIDRLSGRAASASGKSDDAYKRARGAVAGIEPGQPILVGHHSEGRHRRDLDRHDRAMRQSIDAQEKAKELARRADAAARNNAISSDDEDAVVKLKAKIEKLEAAQEQYKAINKVVRNKKLSDEEKVAKIQAIGVSESAARDALKPDFAGRIGIPSYVLSNNNANIARLKQRVESLQAEKAKAEAAPSSQEFDGFSVNYDVDDNRLRIVFDGKPDEAMRAKLKGSGFRWSPSAGAWQRQLNESAKYAAERVLGVELQKSQPLFLFFKANIANRAGMILVPITDRSGRKSARWRKLKIPKATRKDTVTEDMFDPAVSGDLHDPAAVRAMVRAIGKPKAAKAPKRDMGSAPEQGAMDFDAPRVVASVANSAKVSGDAVDAGSGAKAGVDPMAKRVIYQDAARTLTQTGAILEAKSKGGSARFDLTRATIADALPANVADAVKKIGQDPAGWYLLKQGSSTAAFPPVARAAVDAAIVDAKALAAAQEAEHNSPSAKALRAALALASRAESMRDYPGEYFAAKAKAEAAMRKWETDYPAEAAERKRAETLARAEDIERKAADALHFSADGSLDQAARQAAHDRLMAQAAELRGAAA